MDKREKHPPTEQTVVLGHSGTIIMTGHDQPIVPGEDSLMYVRALVRNSTLVTWQKALQVGERVIKSETLDEHNAKATARQVKAPAEPEIPKNLIVRLDRIRKMDLKPAEFKVMTYMAAHVSEEVLAKDVASACGMDVAYISTACTSLVKRGIVYKVKPGVFLWK